MPLLREKNGRWSPEKIIAFAAVLAPLLWLTGRLMYGDLGPRPVTEAIHFTGRWAVRFLLLSLAITPARQIFQWGKLIQARRTLGVASACYALLHLMLYVVDQKLDLGKVASEIVLRFYLTIGFVGVIALLALAVTSTDAAIRRLGPHWGTLHSASYAILIIAIVHFLLQKKLEIEEPILMAGFGFWLLGYRLVRRFSGHIVLPHLVGLAVASAGLTALLEAGWIGVKNSIPPLLVLEANLMFDVAIRPAWWVLAAGIAVSVAFAIASRLRPAPTPRLRPARATSR